VDNHHLRASEVANRRGLMMLMTKFCVVQASNTIPVIQQQRALSMHEMKLGFYRPWEFYMSQLAIAVGIFSTLGSVIGFHVTWLLAGYRTGMHYWSFGWANAFVMSCFSEIMAVILATNLPSYPAAAGAFTGPFTCCLLPLCGLFVATPHLPYIMRGLAYYNPMYYCAGAEVLNQFKDRELIQDDFTGFYVGFTTGNQIVEELGYDHVTGNKYYNCGIAVAQAFLLAVVGYRSLRQLVRQGMMGGDRAA
jgi:ABC-type multidrug transport system permease subunit